MKITYMAPVYDIYIYIYMRVIPEIWSSIWHDAIIVIIIIIIIIKL